MIINQLSCIVSMIVAYILSYNKINRKRIFILAVVAIANMLINIFQTVEKPRFVIAKSGLIF